MNREEFLTQLQDVLQTEKVLSFDTKLQELEEWDSLGAMATMAFLDKKCGVKTIYKDFAFFKTVEDIAKKAGI